MNDLTSWIGRREERQDITSGAPLRGLAALFDQGEPPAWPEGILPPLGHWLYFLPVARQCDIDRDGHPKRGDFLPPISLPRRMWASGSLKFLAPVPVGHDIVRASTIADVREKQGKSGHLVFVSLDHEVIFDGVTAIVERQELVYRDFDRSPVDLGGAPKQAILPQPDSEVTRTVKLDPVQLFRFSALTFNGHRIHYDRDYAREVEGYGGLVVHGPFIAMLLLDHFSRTEPGKQVTEFSFRARKPLLDVAPFQLHLARSETGATLWTSDILGDVTMTADVTAI